MKVYLAISGESDVDIPLGVFESFNEALSCLEAYSACPCRPYIAEFDTVSGEYIGRTNSGKPRKGLDDVQ